MTIKEYIPEELHPYAVKVLKEAKNFLKNKRTSFVCNAVSHATKHCADVPRDKRSQEHWKELEAAEYIYDWISDVLYPDIFYCIWLRNHCQNPPTDSKDFLEGRIGWVDWMIAELSTSKPIHK